MFKIQISGALGVNLNRIFSSFAEKIGPNHQTSAQRSDLILSKMDGKAVNCLTYQVIELN